MCLLGKGVKKVQKKRRQINVSGGGGANIGGGGNMVYIYTYIDECIYT